MDDKTKSCPHREDTDKWQAAGPPPISEVVQLLPSIVGVLFANEHLYCDIFQYCHQEGKSEEEAAEVKTRHFLLGLSAL